MFNFQINVVNPFSCRWKLGLMKSGLLTQNKAWELNTYKTACIINIDCSLTMWTDHAGVRIMLGLFGREVEFHMYDVRHWDEESNSWGA